VVVKAEVLTGMVQDAGINIADYVLYQNYPNPFNASTNIKFRNPKKEFVTLKIFNILGEEVAILVADQLEAGFHHFEFDASHLPRGV
jgi:hypothetical protein